MQPVTQSVNLTGHFLIAMPAMTDPYFSGTLIYICEHTEQGALGIIVNRPIDMTLEALFEKIEVPLETNGFDRMPVYFGGPVQTERGFVLHEPQAAQRVLSQLLEALLKEDRQLRVSQAQETADFLAQQAQTLLRVLTYR